MTVHRRRPLVAIAVCLSLVGSAALVVAERQESTAQAPGAPAAPAARGAGPAGAPQGPGRGRSMANVQEYPANPNDVIQAMPGFQIEVVAKADRLKQGSWISMTEDDQGRIILGANEQQPFTRLTLDKAGKVVKNETIFTPVSEAMGVTWHAGSLYVQGGKLDKPFTETMEFPGFGTQSGKAGLYRLRDPKGDASFGDIATLRTWEGPEGGHSDHGIHEARVSPDGKYFYIINGNGVVQPEDVSPNSPMRNWGDDRIVPLLGAQTGRLGQERPPAGHIARTDFEGKGFQLFAAGFRNAIHFDWNADGDIFSFDSDMEPEFGVPWYRPVRVFWAPSAADMGYRGNSGKYPTYYEDSLPPLVDIGLGSPVGVTFGYRTAFPAPYQRAFFVADNTYGRIIAVHIKPAGSGYVATSWDNFIWPKSLYGATPRMPHNVTDMMIARDGTFYYITGSRFAQSYLLKVTYTGSQPTTRVEYRSADGAADRALRRALEAFHWTRDNPKAVDAAWPYLGSEDRFLRFAARVTLETVSASTWKARALAETDAATSLIAMLALARVGGPPANEDVFTGLARFPLSTLPDRLRIQKLRAIEVAVSRNGKPSDAAIQRVISDVDAVFPGASFDLNTEMSQILSAFNASTAVEKTMQLDQETKIYEEHFAYRYNTRAVTTGWTPALRRQYFQWFNENHNDDQHRYEYREWFNRVNQQPRIAGNGPYLAQVRAAAVATLTDAEKADPQLAAILSAYVPPPAGRGFGGPPPGANAPDAGGRGRGQ